VCVCVRRRRLKTPKRSHDSEKTARGNSLTGATRRKAHHWQVGQKVGGGKRGLWHKMASMIAGKAMSNPAVQKMAKDKMGAASAQME
jgi:hypothetical protein